MPDDTVDRLRSKMHRRRLAELQGDGAFGTLHSEPSRFEFGWRVMAPRAVLALICSKEPARGFTIKLSDQESARNRSQGVLSRPLSAEICRELARVAMVGAWFLSVLHLIVQLFEFREVVGSTRLAWHILLGS